MDEKPIQWDVIMANSAPILQDSDQHPALPAAANAELTFSDLNRDLNNLQDFTHEQATLINKYLTRLRKLGSAGVTLICAGDDCEYRHACPLWQIKDGTPQAVKDPKDPNKTIYVQNTKAPVGKPCPLETTVVIDCYTQYSKHGSVDLANPVHSTYVKELCAIAATEWRINMLLAYASHGIQVEVPAAVSVDGIVYTKPSINELVDLLNRLSGRRAKIHQELTISPMAEYKRKVAESKNNDEGESLAQKQAERKAKIEKALKQQAIPPPEHFRPLESGNKRSGSLNEKK